MWIECTMNKGSKMKSGWLSILKNEKQLLVHSSNVNNIAQIRATHNALANRKVYTRKHTECSPKRMREDEQCVQDLITCMGEFDSYPFDSASPTLRTLQSAMPASGELITDFNSAHIAGEEKVTNFLKDRVFSKNTSIHARVPLSKRLTFAKEHRADSVKEDHKARAAEMEQVLSRQLSVWLRRVNLLTSQSCYNTVSWKNVCRCSTLVVHSGKCRRASFYRSSLSNQ